MSSAFAQRSAGIAGVNGAPRPTLVNVVLGASLVEHDTDVIAISAPTTALPHFNFRICNIRNPRAAS